MVLSYCWWENWGHIALKSDTTPLPVTLMPLSHISSLLLLTVLRNDACFKANVSFSVCERRKKEEKLLPCTLNASHLLALADFLKPIMPCDLLRQQEWEGGREGRGCFLQSAACPSSKYLRPSSLKCSERIQPYWHSAAKTGADFYPHD